MHHKMQRQSRQPQKLSGRCCYASCPSCTVTIQPPPFMLTIPGPSLYCPTKPLCIKQSGGILGALGGGGGGGGGGGSSGGGGGGGGGKGKGQKQGKYNFFLADDASSCYNEPLEYFYEEPAPLEYFYEEPSYPEWESEYGSGYGSGIATLYRSRMALPYSYPRF